MENSSLFTNKHLLSSSPLPFHQQIILRIRDPNTTLKFILFFLASMLFFNRPISSQKYTFFQRFVSRGVRTSLRAPRLLPSPVRQAGHPRQDQGFTQEITFSQAKPQESNPGQLCHKYTLISVIRQSTCCCELQYQVGDHCLLYLSVLFCLVIFSVFQQPFLLGSYLILIVESDNISGIVFWGFAIFRTFDVI